MITFRPDKYFISFSTLATPQTATGGRPKNQSPEFRTQNPKVIIGKGAGQRHHGDDGDRSAAQIGDWPERICTSEFRVGNPHKKQAALEKRKVKAVFLKIIQIMCRNQIF